jgi:hypothetical protein
MGKPPYDQRTDIERLQSQWTKLTGLHNRNEASAAIVRCATAAEIAANFAIRTEFSRRSQFDAGIVDGFLTWANGLDGKINRLILPICFNGVKSAEFKRLQAAAKKIHEVRNEIVHRGVFSDPEDAASIVGQAREFIETLVHRYDDTFRLPEASLRTRSRK